VRAPERLCRLRDVSRQRHVQPADERGVAQVVGIDIDRLDRISRPCSFAPTPSPLPSPTPTPL
jgi:hypothetical protein